MSDFTQIHIALFDELERQGIHCADVGKLTLPSCARRRSWRLAPARMNAAKRVNDGSS